MKFAFLIHPISSEVSDLTRLDFDTGVLSSWGTDPLGLLSRIHGPEAARRYASTQRETGPVVIDEICGPTTSTGEEVRGRLIEIPMNAAEILDDPDAALHHIEHAVEMATDWGAGIVGLGAMTAVVGGRGTHVAEQSTIAVTTGNSLTVYAAIRGLFNAADELNFDLRRETVAVVGIPGSIASAAAILLEPHCKELILVGRRASGPAQRLAERLKADLVLDIAEATDRARIVLSATSSGNCIDQSTLRPGTIVVDVGVPADVIGDASVRPDVLVLTGGLAAVPPDGRWHSPRVIRFQRGIIPSCMCETMLLGLENRRECFSLGRVLDVDRIAEIGQIAETNGFRFSQLCSFGQVLDDAVLSEFRKYVRRDVTRSPARATENASPTELAQRAATCFRRHINPPLSTFLERAGLSHVFVRGEGTSLYDENGKRYLDLVAGYGSLNLGHNHPSVVEALRSALASFPPNFAPSSINPYASALAEELVSVAPAGLQQVFFCNSGAEATEAALKLARAATGRSNFAYCRRSFHGKTMGALSVTGKRTLQAPFLPLPNHGGDAVEFGDLESLERALSRRDCAAFIVEPVQGEAGIYVPPDQYLKQAEQICRKTGTLLIADEVQTGFGRTGKLFACEHEQVEPDVMTVAKSLGGGLVPIGAMLARRDVWNRAYGTVQTCLLHTSTFSGGSLACAAGLAAVRALVREDLAGRARMLGERMITGLKGIAGRVRCLREVRGRGLLIGIEFREWPQTAINHWKSLDETGMSQFVSGYEDMVASLHTLQAMYILQNRFGICVQSTRSNPQVLRLQPPLTITESDVDRVLEAVEATCREVDHICGALTGGVSKSSLGRHDAKSSETAPREIVVDGATSVL